eukprot:7958636-Lingulodinium_polyedra.AAC.1
MAAQRGERCRERGVGGPEGSDVVAHVLNAIELGHGERREPEPAFAAAEPTQRSQGLPRPQ